MDSSPDAERRARYDRVLAAAEVSDGILSLAELYAVGITRSEVRAHVRARRWQRAGRQSICVHCGPLTVRARYRAAVHAAGPRAYLDGAAALVLAGLTHYEPARIRVSVPRGARVWQVAGLDIRQTRRWCADDVVTTGVPRARPEVAAVHEALWARSDRQAALVLTMVVQQGLTTCEQLAAVMMRVRRDRRRGLVNQLLIDLAGGVRALSELDVARECRRRGLPEPDRQVVRRGRGGRYYLDVVWARWGLAVEVDGIQHGWVQNAVSDALRHNDVALTGLVVLRLPVLGLRLAPDEFFTQIETALRAGGWAREAA